MRSESSTGLGANIKRVQLPDGTMAWSIDADEYVNNALVTVKATLQSKGMKLKGKASKPLPTATKTKPATAAVVHPVTPVDEIFGAFKTFTD